MSSSASRQAKFREAQAAIGLVQCNLWIPAGAVPEFQLAAEIARENRTMTIGRMVDRLTGKLASLRRQ